MANLNFDELDKITDSDGKKSDFAWSGLVSRIKDTWQQKRMVLSTAWKAVRCHRFDPSLNFEKIILICMSQLLRSNVLFVFLLNICSIRNFNRKIAEYGFVIFGNFLWSDRTVKLHNEDINQSADQTFFLSLDSESVTIIHCVRP